MVGTKTHFTEELAPCGRVVGGDRITDDDMAGLLFDHVTYACGCRRLRDEFHDGSIHVRTIRHDGKVLSDEHSGDHEA